MAAEPMAAMAALALLLLLFLSLLSTATSQPRSLLLNCGSTTPTLIDNRTWLPDAQYTPLGTPKTIPIPNLLPTLTTLRSFPLTPNPQKFCYTLPVFRKATYLIRTTYYYYNAINNRGSPPVFDQIVDGTLWGVVNTTDDYVRGFSSYYEGVFLAQGKTLSLCVASNSYTDSDPFINALELVLLESSLYNSTHFETNGLSLVARTSFGYEGSLIKYPDDPFDRFWEPYGDTNPIMQTISNVSVSGFWNRPPSKVFNTGITTDGLAPLELQWPPGSLANSNYYISLYFADNRDASLGKSRVFTIMLNGVEYYRNLNVSSSGVAVFATSWPLGGLTNITLAPATGSEDGPVINAGEVFRILLLGGRTATRDVIGLEKVKNSLRNPPPDWTGDPCLPRQYSWTGVTCSEGPRIRVVTLNMSSMGLSGSISDGIANLTALSDIWFGSNNLSGPIPDLSSLKMLKSVHLENNQFSGEILSSLGTIASLQELFLYNNNLTGEVPNSLVVKPGLNLKISPGNHFTFQSLSPSPSPTN